MKRERFLLFCLIYNCFVFAQIPYATQQPKWCFPIYAEDATGKKDTIYIGDDPTAKNGNSANPIFNDIQFGEKWIIPQNGSDFNLATYYWISPTDSVMKVNINNYLISNNLYYTITLSNVTLPVKFKWDKNRLRSDSLPFPNQAPLPRGQINITFPVGNYWVEDPNVSCNINIPIIVSDTIKSQCYCYAKDSLTLLDPFGNPNPQSFFLGFEVLPWVGNSPTGIKVNIHQTDFSVAPSPFTNYIQVTSKSKSVGFGEYYIIIYNSMGSEIISTNFTNTTTNINTSDFDNGIYCIKVLGEKGELLDLRKIIKTK